MTYTLMIYDIVLHYKEFFFQTQPDIANILKIYDIIVQHKEKFAWNIDQYHI